MAAPLLLLRCMFSMKPRTFKTHVKFGRYLEVRVFTVSPIVCKCMQIIVEREESTGVSETLGYLFQRQDHFQQKKIHDKTLKCILKGVQNVKRFFQKLFEVY